MDRLEMHTHFDGVLEFAAVEWCNVRRMKNEARFYLEADRSSVQFWVDTRLPFEPKGNMREARDALRKALLSLEPKSGHILAATYRSLDCRFCDVENVLLYNVGAAAFAAVAMEGLRFERNRTQPPSSPCGGSFNHYHEYRLIEPSHSPPRDPCCSLNFEICSLTSATKPHQIWWPASVASTGPSRAVNGLFEMRVIVKLPNAVRNMTSVIKPLLDGVISALHSDPQPSPDAVTRLAAKTGWKSEEIIHRLQSPQCPVLGPRRLLDAYRDFVKWNPADDLCEACTVLYEPSLSRECRVEVWSWQDAR
ncbi:hypothetical protein Mal52_53650 [Symmachiella dynata]|uniref:Uncharacterized protein n=1 Tax=Symmachiella dynata TaxID=2527995 RepID=A0A517ZWG4_9PLAN|nr:hypothetical protein [Symmachiella dynata]QDU46842.1 hypothetical protein Mal52_53650 [Symmachiella dynata]